MDSTSAPRPSGAAFGGWQPRSIQNGQQYGQQPMPVSTMGRPLYVPAGAISIELDDTAAFPMAAKAGQPIKLPGQTRVTPEEYREFLSLGHGQIFDLEADRVMDAAWRLPGADPSDFFNYGMDIRKWKDYAGRVQQYRLEYLMQHKISTYEGSPDGGLDPELPPELAAALAVERRQGAAELMVVPPQPQFQRATMCQRPGLDPAHFAGVSYHRFDGSTAQGSFGSIQPFPIFNHATEPARHQEPLPPVSYPSEVETVAHHYTSKELTRPDLQGLGGSGDRELQSSKAFDSQFLPPPFVVPSNMTGFPSPFESAVRGLPPPFKAMDNDKVLSERGYNVESTEQNEETAQPFKRQRNAESYAGSLAMGMDAPANKVPDSDHDERGVRRAHQSWRTTHRREGRSGHDLAQPYSSTNREHNSQGLHRRESRDTDEGEARRRQRRHGDDRGHRTDSSHRTKHRSRSRDRKESSRSKLERHR